MIDMNAVVGVYDLALIVFDTLRYDVAVEELAAGRTPNLAKLLPPTGWEERHSPGTFTYASHAAFFAGFFPTPAKPGHHPRRLALGFEGSTTIAPGTCVLEGANIVEGLTRRGYHTICIGGTGFFNQQNPLGHVFPSLFREAHWSRYLGVTDPHSFEHQLDTLERAHVALPAGQLAFSFVNVSALHQPNHFYLPHGPATDTRESHAAALRYVDAHVPRLFEILRHRRPVFAIVCSDHGTLYGEDGYTGHRVGHPIVTTVPYTEVVLS